VPTLPQHEKNTSVGANIATAREEYIRWCQHCQNSQRIYLLVPTLPQHEKNTSVGANIATVREEYSIEL
jgi:hypothetical protein